MSLRVVKEMTRFGERGDDLLIGDVSNVQIEWRKG